jgi:hypothetical protein
VGRTWFALVAAVVVAACAGASSTATTPSTPVQSIAPAAAPCVHLKVVGEPMPRDIATTATLSPFIAVATFEGTGTSSWSSPNGDPPRSEREASSLILATAIRLSVDRLIRGTADDVAHAAIDGGTVGCSSVTYDNPLELSVGTRSVLRDRARPGRCRQPGQPLSLVRGMADQGWRHRRYRS